jgi:hypothetical protein
MRTRTRSNSLAGGSFLPPASSDAGPDRFPAGTEADQDAGDLLPGVDEDALEHDELDTDRITSV